MNKASFISLVFSLLVTSGASAQEVSSIKADVERPTSEKPFVFRTSATMSSGILNTGPSNNDNLVDAKDGSDSFSILDVQLSLDLKSGLSGYIDLPFTWDSSSDGTFGRVFGRPELGASQNLISTDDFSVTGGFAIRLPIYEETDQSITGGNRVWQIGPTLSVDARLAKSKFHFVASEKFSYDSPARVALPVPDSSGDLSLESDGLERSTALRTSVGIEYQQEKFTAGVAARTIDGLGSGKVVKSGAVLREVSPLDLMGAVISGSYEFPGDTKVNATFTKGIKTRSDSYTLISQDAPDEIASSVIAFGIIKAF